MNRFKQIGLYFILKYFLIFIISSIIAKNYSIFRIDELKNFSSLFFYLWIILFFPVLNFIIFSVPINLSFKLNKTLWIIANLIFILLEVLLYIYFTSQKYIAETQSVLLFLISMIIFLIFFNEKLLNKNIKMK